MECSLFTCILPASSSRATCKPFNQWSQVKPELTEIWKKIAWISLIDLGKWSSHKWTPEKGSFVSSISFLQCSTKYSLVIDYSLLSLIIVCKCEIMVFLGLIGWLAILVYTIAVPTRSKVLLIISLGFIWGAEAILLFQKIYPMPILGSRGVGWWVD